MDEDFTAWLMRDTFGLEDDSPDVPSWHAQAACRDRPDVTWFPERADDWRPAVAVCNECPVRQECLQWALDHGEGIGIWGGLTARQRERHTQRAA